MNEDQLRTEAETILNFFNEELGMICHGDQVLMPGPYVDGFRIIPWMRENNLSWREVEWAGFFVRQVAQIHFQEHPELGIVPFTQGKLYRLKGKFLWDIRLHAESKIIVILTDAASFERDIFDNNGLGIIILHAEFEPDDDGSFRQFITELKGGESDYEARRRAEGAPIRTRKKGFFLWWGQAIFITPDDINDYGTQSWLCGNFQVNMRNSDDRPRNAKYFLNLDDLPPGKEILRMNFNLDPTDYGEYFE